MSYLPTLFQQNTTWAHYIGRYYQSTDLFIREARRLGITRRVPMQIAASMQFGDRVILLRYDNRRVFAFAEMVITGVVFDERISKSIGERLVAEGRATFNPGGGACQRECGTYIVIGTYTVADDVDLPEIIQAATEIAAQNGLKPFVMISGELYIVYDNPIFLDPAPPFTRSFMQFDRQPTYKYLNNQLEAANRIIEIEGYEKKQVSRRGRAKRFRVNQAGLL